LWFKARQRQIVLEILSRKKTLPQKRAGGVAQGVSPEFRLPYNQKKKKKKLKKEKETAAYVLFKKSCTEFEFGKNLN
jgi:hypothetical protein